MSGSVTPCLECGQFNWAGEEKCEVCGGKLAPTLRQIHAYLYHTDPEFKKMVDDGRKAKTTRVKGFNSTNDV